jgi:hypothetical protein
LLLRTNSKIQTFSEKVAIKAYDYLDLLDTYKQLKDSIKNCTSRAIILVEMKSSPDEQEKITISYD